MGLFKRNPFGHILFLKKWLIRIFGVMTHRRYRGFNEMHIEGSEIIKNLPNNRFGFSISRHPAWITSRKQVFRDYLLGPSTMTATTKTMRNAYIMIIPNVYAANTFR